MSQRLDEIQELLNQLSPKKKHKITAQKLDRILGWPNFRLVLEYDTANENKIIGMASIGFVETLTGCKGFVDNVIVDRGYRGKGLGERLMQRLIEIARDRGAMCVNLTSSPEREAANKLYLKLGFEKRETNVYRLTLN